MPGPKLTIGNQAPNPVRLEAFLSGLERNAELRAKKDPDGNTVLYASTKPSSWISRMSGRAAQKREAAKKVIDSTINQLQARALKGAVNTTMRQETESRFNQLKGAVTDRAIKAFRVRSVKFGIKVAAAYAEAAPNEFHDKSGAPLHKLQDLPMAAQFAARLLREGQEDNAAKLLGDMIAKDMESHFENHEKQAFALSAGIGLRQKLGEMLEKKMGAELDKILPPGRERNSFLRKAVEHAQNHILPATDIEKTITIGKDVFTKRGDKPMASGGYADVYAYERKKETGETETIAVKIFKKDPEGENDKKLDEFGREAIAHQAATSDGAKNIIGIKGAFRTTDGLMAVALEYAPHGDVEGMQNKLHAAVTDGKISIQAASAVRLTLLNDMARGVAELERKGIVDGDVKPQNALISESGEVKIADLGTAQVTESFVLANSPPIDNPRWLSPEILAAQAEVSNIENLTSQAVEPQAQQAFAQVRQALDMQDGEPLNQKRREWAQNLLTPLTAEKSRQVSAGNKGDAWALGVTAFNLLHGRDLTNLDDVSNIKSRIKQFAEDDGNRAISENGFAAPSAFVAEDDLINQLMHPNPAQRMSAQQALDHRAFRAPGVGSQAARDLIVALAKGDHQAMAQASAKLGPPPRANPNQGRALPPTPQRV